MTDEADMRDPHATEQDMADYIGVLLKNGFSEVTETVDVEYSDYDGVVSYLEQYAQSLINNGFRPVMADEEEIDHYDSADGFYNFRYHFDEDNSLTLLFKSERYISADETEAMITETGFTAIDLSDPITTRDLKKYQKIQFGNDYKTYLTVSLTFDTMQDAEQFLGNYETSLNEVVLTGKIPELSGLTNRSQFIMKKPRCW